MSLGAALNQLHPFQTRMSITADDDVVVHRDAERLRNLDDLLRHLDIRLRRRRVAAGMIVHQSTTPRISLIFPTHI
jgi:hypothetical protein